MIKKWSLALSQALLLVLTVFAHNAWAQTPTIWPGKVFVEPQPSVAYQDGNVAKIHWRKGNGSNYILLIRVLDYYGLNSPPALVEPDNRPYATSGNYRMDANSLVPARSPFPASASQTYLLRTAAYSGAADTTATVQNAMIGMMYEVTVFEYNPDPNGNYYSYSKPTTFMQPRITPRITRTGLDTFKRPVVTFNVPAELLTSEMMVQWATDTTAPRLSSNGIRVVPALANTTGQTYTITLPFAYTGGPLYIRATLQSYYRPALGEQRTSKYIPFTSVFTAFQASPGTGSSSSLKLDWTVPFERDNVGFQVQRSVDSLAWTQVAMVASRGNSSTEEAYSYTTTKGATSYYRILQIGQGSAVTGISSLLRVVGTATPLATAPAANTALFSAFPNPATNQLHLATVDQSRPVELLNSVGQLVRQQLPTQTLAVEDLPRGLYVLRQGPRSTRITLQ